MKSKITQFAAAAVIIIAAALSITLLDKTVPAAYGMTIVAEQLQKADTIHILSWCSFGKGLSLEKGRTEYDLEDWIDLKRGCFRTNGIVRVPPEFKVAQSEQVFDGKYLMDINHGLKRVKFYRQTEFQRTLLTRQTLETFIQRMSMTSDELSGYIKVAQESIDDDVFDIWEREPSSNSGRLYKKVCWVSPSTRELKRHETWIKNKDSEAQWVLTSSMDVELNAVPPSDTFETIPPVGYRQVNTKKATLARRLFNRTLPLETIKGEVAAVFTLGNGSVVMGYFTEDIGGDEPTNEVFEKLQVGGQLPELPVEIYGLKLSKDEEGLTFVDYDYVGRHLANTQKGGKTYEWVIYVPEVETIPNDGWRRYRMLARLHPVGRQDSQVKWFDQSSLRSFTIRANEFDTFIRGAMTECSDGVIAPEHVTYEKVIRLAEEIRASMEE